MGKVSNYGALEKALNYAGAFNNDMQFQVRKTVWKWDDEEEPRTLGEGYGYVPRDHFQSRRLHFLFIDGHPAGPWSEYNPTYQEMRWNEGAGELTIRGKSSQGRGYEFQVFFMSENKADMSKIRY